MLSQVETIDLWREQKLPVPFLGGWGRVSWWWHRVSCLAPTGISSWWGGGGSGWWWWALAAVGLCPCPGVCVWKLRRPHLPSHLSSLIWPSLLFVSYGYPDTGLVKGEKEATNLLKFSWDYFVLLWGFCVKGVSTLSTPINTKPLLLIGFAYGKEKDWPLNSLNKANLKNNFS